eukprot:CAMPEP_0194503792 /NCGR_PEP_ID=MMETSP0253-20130528/28582_1 /TAXON_ID=2966 /ORGANISM="Noctiluca scintillans" /LENGTH=57 /DNA_ID=CAMNT_0039346115 /DNA_START=33 /DNA_END=203 /DNA_ORIENTATION=-
MTFRPSVTTAVALPRGTSALCGSHSEQVDAPLAEAAAKRDSAVCSSWLEVFNFLTSS